MRASEVVIKDKVAQIQTMEAEHSRARSFSASRIFELEAALVRLQDEAEERELKVWRLEGLVESSVRETVERFRRSEEYLAELAEGAAAAMVQGFDNLSSPSSAVLPRSRPQWP